MEASIDIAVTDYERIGYGIRRLFKGKPFTKVEQFVPELKLIKNLECL